MGVLTMTYHRKADALEAIAHRLLEVAQQLRGLAPKRTPKPAQDTTWATEAHALWDQQIGVISYPRLRKALAPLILSRGWERVKPAYLCYLSSRPYQRADGSIVGDDPARDARQPVFKSLIYCTPEHFAQTFSFWEDRCRVS
jgi:hypothetical protein